MGKNLATWVEFSALDVGVLVTQLHSWLKQPSLKLKTRPEQLLGSLPVNFRPSPVFANLHCNNKFVT
jgi:hypothetical protein